MGLLDDAIRDHLDLKRRHGANEEEIARLEHEALGPVRRAEPVAPALEPLPPEPEIPPPVEAEEHAEADAEPAYVDAEAWLEEDEPDEVPAEEALEHHPQRTAPFTPEEVEEAQAPPADELEETPEFLQETPEHERLWFEQRPPRDFDFDA